MKKGNSRLRDSPCRLAPQNVMLENNPANLPPGTAPMRDG